MIAHAAADAVSLAGTLTAAAAAATPWQAVVVGAGPAGAATAWRLAARGLRVLLVDRGRLPRWKVCGCCLSPRACAELSGLGPAALPEVAGSLDTVVVLHRGRLVRLPLPAGRVISRDALDVGLARGAIGAGVEWLPDAHVAAVRDGSSAAPLEVVIESRGTTSARQLVVQADRVILATGLVDHVRTAGSAAAEARAGRRIARGSLVGLGAVLAAGAAHLPPGELVMAVGRRGYCGLVRLEDGRIDVAAAVERAAIAVAGGPAGAVAGLLREAAGCGGVPHEADILAAAFQATPALTRRAPPVAGPTQRILRVGDAAGYVEPFTGEGIGWALAGARILAESVADSRGLHAPAEAARRYVFAHRRLFGPLHVRCGIVTAGLRWPIVVAAALAAAQCAPGAARRLVSALVGAAAGGAS